MILLRLQLAHIITQKIQGNNVDTSVLGRTIKTCLQYVFRDDEYFRRTFTIYFRRYCSRNKNEIR